jgi:hypothetical protein
MNKHGLKTSVGIKDKKIDELEQKLAQYESIKPKSPEGEALKAAIRVIVSYGVGIGVSILYSKYPVLGTPPEGLLEILVGTLTFMIDKWIYQFKKNKGELAEGVGIDWIILSLANVMKRKKSTIKGEKSTK